MEYDHDELKLLESQIQMHRSEMNELQQKINNLQKSVQSINNAKKEKNDKQNLVNLYNEIVANGGAMICNSFIGTDIYRAFSGYDIQVCHYPLTLNTSKHNLHQQPNIRRNIELKTGCKIMSVPLPTNDAERITYDVVTEYLYDKLPMDIYGSINSNYDENYLIYSAGDQFIRCENELSCYALDKPSLNITATISVYYVTRMYN